jgi:DNA-binding NtrC family response regulator
VAATHRYLDVGVAAGHFREDLLYRLDTVRVEVPPLRAHREDVRPLVAHMLARLTTPGAPRRQVTPAALALLEAHTWPGNVRELLHVVEHGLVVADGDIDAEHLPRSVRGSTQPPPAPDEGPLCTLRDVERAHISRALQRFGGNRAQAARALGISERNLYRKLHEHDLC